MVELWVYNTKTKILGIYISKEGLSIKGTTLTNFDPELSIGKRIKHLPTTKHKSFIEKQSTKPHYLTGRLNHDTILLHT